MIEFRERNKFTQVRFFTGKSRIFINSIIHLDTDILTFLTFVYAFGSCSMHGWAHTLVTLEFCACIREIPARSVQKSFQGFEIHRMLLLSTKISPMLAHILSSARTWLMNALHIEKKSIQRQGGAARTATGRTLPQKRRKSSFEINQPRDVTNPWGIRGSTSPCHHDFNTRAFWSTQINCIPTPDTFWQTGIDPHLRYCVSSFTSFSDRYYTLYCIAPVSTDCTEDCN